MKEARRTGEDGEITGRTLSVPERVDALRDYVAQAAGRGWREEGRGNLIAFLVSGERVNHRRHALLALFTGGLWLPVWAGTVVFGGKKRMLAIVDRFGEVRTEKL